MTMAWILDGHNLVFIIPLGLALVYLGLYTLSGWTFGDADVDADADIEADAEVEVEVEVEADAEIEADADADADHDADAHHHHLGGGGGSSGLLAVLSFFGLGRAPLSLLLMILLMSWGVIGFAANTYVRESLPQLRQDPWLLSIPLAAIGSLLITKFFAGFVGRYLPMSETYARRRHEFLGHEGEVILPTNATFGLVAVRDARGERFQLPCRLEAGGRTIAKGTKVRLVAYNADEKLFYVLESDFSGAPQQSRDPAHSGG